jgi:hypothetical protein
MKSAVIPKSNLDNFQLEEVVEFFLNKVAGDQAYKSIDVPYSIDGKLDNPDVLESITKSLIHNGFVVLGGFVDSKVVDEARLRIDRFVDRLGNDLNTDSYVTRDAYIVQNSASDSKRFDSFSKLAASDIPVVNVRNKVDVGMVDVFNIDKADDFFRKNFGFLQSESVVNAIGSALGQSLPAKNLNAYINKGVTETRGFHADAFIPHAKAMVYLTDVLSLDDGPYCYARGTHSNQTLRKINQVVNQDLKYNPTDFSVISQESIVPVLGKKGSVVISFQFGSHRGAPQKKGHSRYAIVQSYY